MTPKLPAKIYRLKRSKKYGLIGATLLNVSAIIFFFRIALFARLIFGQFIFIVLGVAASGALVFTLYGLITLGREGFTGMLLNALGINDLSTGHTYGVVQWKSVTGIHIVTDVEHPKRQYIVLNVANPRLYIERERSQLKRRSMILKYRYYGSPVVFSNRGIDCSFDELEATIREYYHNYQVRKKEREATASEQ